MIQFGAIYLCALLAHLLPLHIGYFLADRIADLTFLVWRRGRHNMIDNMRHVLGPSGTLGRAEFLARRALRNYLRYLVDFLRSPWLTAEELERRMEFNRWEPFEEARAGGKGTIFVGLHMGNWDFGAALISKRGFSINVVADTFDNPRLDAFVRKNRTRLGLNPIPRAQAARRVLHLLRTNQGIAILMDRPVPEQEGVTVSFFGYPTAVPAGAAVLALKTGARVIPAGMIRNGAGNFRGIVDRPVYYTPTGDQATDVQALTQQLMDILAAWVQEYPDQWFMFRRMWPDPAGPRPTGP